MHCVHYAAYDFRARLGPGSHPTPLGTNSRPPPDSRSILWSSQDQRTQQFSSGVTTDISIHELRPMAGDINLYGSTTDRSMNIGMVRRTRPQSISNSCQCILFTSGWENRWTTIPLRYYSITDSMKNVHKIIVSRVVCVLKGHRGSTPTPHLSCFNCRSQSQP